MIMVVALGGMLAACGVTKETETASGVESIIEASLETEQQEAGEVEFPIRIEHAYGETVISAKPDRVVTISWENADTPLALGMIPVGVSEANYGARTSNRLHAWTDEAFHQLGIDSPNVFNDTDGWDYEAIADTHPDVILCAYSGISQEEYDILSQIAPVVPYKEEAFHTTWRAQTIENATALGMAKEGAQLVAETEALIREKVQAYPEIAGKNAAFMWFSADDLSNFYIYLPVDPRAAFLEDLGMVLPESIRKMANDEQSFSISVSRERVEELMDVDLIVTYGDETLLQALQNDKILNQIPAIQNGAVVLLDDNTELAAGVTPSILSIPYTIDQYLETLSVAANKVQG